MQSKISPPRLDDRYLFRNRLMESVASRQGASTKLILVEAQAGQGKSTFAAQYLSHIGADYSWYQLGPEDRDPVALIGALLSALMEALPAFCTSLLHGMIKNGEVTANEPFRFAKILRDDLRPILRGDFYLVLDDVHLIEDSADSLAFLKALIETAPRGLRFILLSRGPAPCDMASEGRLVVGNDELALTPREIAELFGSKLGLSIPTDTVLALDRLTEGWAMGLALAGQVLSREGGTYHLAEVLPTLQRGGILDYFLAEILARLPGEQRCAILKLSLLENIPVPLAETLTEVGEIQVLLTRWLEQNLFLRRLDEAGSLFIFHRLFRDSLRAVAESEIPREECRQVLREAGAW